MVGARLKISTLAAITLLAASAAQAADYPPPPQPISRRRRESFAEGWYLRGFVGAGINDTYNLEYLPSPPNVGQRFRLRQNSNSDTFFVGGGVGYEWNNWLRFDATAEYRAQDPGQCASASMTKSPGSATPIRAT